MSSIDSKLSAGTVPRWVPGALFLLATAALFGPFIFSDQMLYGEDSLSLGYMVRAFLSAHLRAGDFPLWNPRLLGGMPTLEALSAGDSVYPTSLLYYLVEPHRALGWKLVLHVLAGGFFMFGWARSLGMGRAAATIGGLAWLMAPVMVTLTLPGNDGKLMVASLAPLVFWGAESVLQRPSGRSAAGLAGAVALTCLTTQFQSSYFLFGTVGAYALFRAIGLWRAGTSDAERAAGGARLGPGAASTKNADARRAQGQGAASALGDGPPSANGLRRAQRRRAVAAFGAFLGASALGGGLAAFQLLPAFDYVGEYSRRVATTVEATPAEAIAYSSSWSLHPEEVVGLAVPEFVGNTAADAEWAQGTYWGRNALKLNHEYIGATVIVLALVGLLGRRRKGLRWFMGGMSATWLLFALGPHTPVWRIFYEVVPGIGLFRVPAIAAFLVSFGATTLCALGVQALADAWTGAGQRGGTGAGQGGAKGRAGLSGRDGGDAWAKLGVGAADFFGDRRGAAVAGFAALLLVGLLLQGSGALTSFWTTMVHSGAGPRQLAALDAASPFMTKGFGIALLLATLTAGVVWAGVARRLPFVWALAALGLLIAVDLGRVDRAFIRTFDFAAFATPNANVRFLQARRDQEEPFRVADLRQGGRSDQNVELAMHGLDLIAGHHPNDLARYRRLLGLEGSQAQGTNTRHPNVLRMMNVRYVVLSGPPGQQGPQPASSARTARGDESVYPYPGLGRAWVVRRTEVAEDDDAALARILSADFDPANTAVLADVDAASGPLAGRTGAGGAGRANEGARVAGAAGIEVAARMDAAAEVGGAAQVGGSPDAVEWIVADPDHRALNVRTAGPALLVISENWFPGWVAEVDGQPAPVHRANLTLQAVPIPDAGDHAVTLRFTAPSVRSALWISGAALLATLALLAASLARGRRTNP